MNPITQSLEILDFPWNSRRNAYVYRNNSDIVISWDEVKNLKLDRIHNFVKRKIAGYRKEQRKQND